MWWVGPGVWDKGILRGGCGISFEFLAAGLSGELRTTSFLGIFMFFPDFVAWAKYWRFVHRVDSHW